MTVVMSGKKVANYLSEEIEQEMTVLAKKDITPNLAIIRVGDEAGSVAYEKSLKRKFNEIGMDVTPYNYPSDITQEKFLEEFRAVNDNQTIHGILVLRPLPEHLETKEITRTINPVKDVDGMSPTNLGRIMVDDQDGLISATPAAVMKMFEYYEIDVEGRDVVIIGHSEVVGKPLSILLLNQNATVTVTHIYSKHTKEMARQADILITATGQPGLVTDEYVKYGAIVVDVGISRVDGEILGDVAYDEVEEETSFITPVPGGVGAVTTTMLASNVIKATKLLTNS